MGDTTLPVVGIASPVSAQTVAGMVTLSANASDNVRVAGVRFQVDGADVGGHDSAIQLDLEQRGGE